MPQLSHFGSFQGQDLFECQLRSENGVIIKVINFGAIIRDWQVPTRQGDLRSVVLGFEQLEDYVEHSPFFGAIVGRVANRVGKARFSVDGKEFVLPPNEGQNQLHGGTETFARKVWKMEPISDHSMAKSSNPCAVRLFLESRDGEGAYPGNFRVTVTYRLTGNKLRMAEKDGREDVNKRRQEREKKKRMEEGKERMDGREEEDGRREGTNGWKRGRGWKKGRNEWMEERKRMEEEDGGRKGGG
uniref:Galactose mutarotase n=1 Tax=Globodera pallida TaxID=36090 RepID=A0A183BVT6_GLOPA